MDPASNATVANPPAEPTAAELEEIFRSGYNDEPKFATPTPQAPAADDQAPAPASTPKAEAAPAPPSSEDNDPYASLPDDVRQQLARIPALEHDVASNRARVSALNRKLEQARSAAAPASATPTPPAEQEPVQSVERVRGELPEVAQAIEDEVRVRIAAAIKAAAPAPEPSPSAQPPKDASDAAEVTQDERWLNENRPGWADKFISTDFQLWLGRQPDDYRTRMMGTDKAADIVDAFTKFDAVAKAPVPSAGDGLAERRSARARAAVTPQGAGARAPSRAKVMTDEEVFAAGFRGEDPDV